jgi:hypothetical protein
MGSTPSAQAAVRGNSMRRKAFETVITENPGFPGRTVASPGSRLADPVILRDVKPGMKTKRQTIRIDFDQNMMRELNVKSGMKCSADARCLLPPECPVGFNGRDISSPAG